MSQSDPTCSFLSSPGILVSGLVYLVAGVVFLHTSVVCTSCCCNAPSLGSDRIVPKGPSPQAGSTHTPEKLAPGSIAATPKTPPSKRPIVPPTAPTPLAVKGFQDAVYVGPEASIPKPWRVTVVLHGNYDRPEWQCDTWRAVADFYGWILCPRGIPTYWAPKSEDRWMYRGAERTAREIDAAIAALKTAYPGNVEESDMILVGFSLGAILSPSIIKRHPHRYKTLFVIEGLVDKLDKRQLRELKKNGIQAMGLAMSTGKYRAAAKTVMQWLQKLNVRAEFINMAGAGHDYHPSFSKTARPALKRLTGHDGSPE
jgi:predicted esterase